METVLLIAVLAVVALGTVTVRLYAELRAARHKITLLRALLADATTTEDDQ